MLTAPRKQTSQNDFLDRAAAVGLKVLYEVDHSGWIKRHAGDLDRTVLAAELDALAANISLVKEHPALLGYYICGERPSARTPH